MHYAFNTNRDMPFWRHCREKTDLAGAARFVDHYRENGPTSLWQPTMMESFHPFGVGGHAAVLLGQAVPFVRTSTATDSERKLWAQRVRQWDESARRAIAVKEALAVVRSPKWRWVTPQSASSFAHRHAVEF